MKTSFLLLLCITFVLSAPFPFGNKGHSTTEHRPRNLETLESLYADEIERAETVPESWYCNDAYYGSGDGCDCECGAPDPDCSNSTSDPFNCDPGQICVYGYCSQKAPAGWLCSATNYNATDGCDCDCGVYDPDCDDTTATVFGCYNMTNPGCTARGSCYELPSPPVRLSIYEEGNTVLGVTINLAEFYFARCGSVLNKITIMLLDESYNPVNDTRGQTVTVTVSAKASDDSVSVSLAGKTSVAMTKGKALFDNIIVLGTADSEFTLMFTSQPVYIPVSPIFRVRLSAGAPATVSIKTNVGLPQANGSLTVPLDTEIKALVSVRDQCGNIVKNPPTIQCLTYEHFSLTNETKFCDEETKYNSNTSISVTPNEIGVYDVFFFNEDVNQRSGIYNEIALNVIPQSEYNCFKLNNLAQGVTALDVSNFNNLMISNASFARIRELLFSVDAIRPAVIAFNVSQSTRTSEYHAKLAEDYKQWVLASKHFFIEQSAQFLTVISLTLVEVEASGVNVTMNMPFCGSVNPDMQKQLIGLWLFALSDTYAAFISKATDATSANVRSTDDVVCSGKYPDYKCCPRTNLEIHGQCAAPQIGAVSIALVVLSIIFAIIAAIYVTTLVAVFAVQNGAVKTHMEDLKSLSEDEYSKKRTMALLFTIFVPAIAICGTAQNILLIESGRSFSGLKILVGIVEGVVILCWYIVAFYSYVKIYVKSVAPAQIVDKAYFVLALAVLSLSAFNIFWTFAWVTLGLLLNPERVVAYFVAFLTVFLVAAFKLQSLINFMNTVEVALQKQLFKKLLTKGTIKEDELEELLANTVELENSKLRVYLEDKGFNEKDVDVVATQIEKYRRFRVKFIIGNVIGTLFFLTSLIIFILLGVEAFRQKSGIVSSVGSVLEGLSGVGVAVKEKMGDSEQQVRELVDQFAKKRGASAASGELPMQDIGMDSITQ